ncbi:MAG: LamB/YcsF family protein [Desulfobacterales bacterium]
MKRIDLNCDMGESFGAYTMGMDAEVLKYVSSANIACGFHAGDPRVMHRTVRMARDHGTGIGAHPGFPDLVGFGRRTMECTLEELRDDLIYQIGALQAFCTHHGVPMQHVKPHGALYNMSVGNEAIARTIAEAIASLDKNLSMVTLAGKHADLMNRIGREAGIRMVFEAFPDRAYTPEGTLASRRLPGAVIHDPQEAADRALRMAEEGAVIAVDGTRVSLEVHTLCVHGDNPKALDLVRTIRERLESSGISVTPMGRGGSS